MLGRIVLFPVKCEVRTERFDLASVLLRELRKNRVVLREKDILVVSSKFAAISQGRLVWLDRVLVTPKAMRLSSLYGLRAELAQIVLDESNEILGGVPGYLLGMSEGILAPNAGIDLSNVPTGFAVLQPTEPENLSNRLMLEIRSNCNIHKLGVILSDSRITPTRLGTVGIAVASSGILKTIDLRGASDLFGKKLKVTLRAIADQVATAAQLCMGESTEAVPAVLVRGVDAAFVRPKSDLEKRSNIALDKCLIISGLRNYYKKGLGL